LRSLFVDDDAHSILLCVDHGDWWPGDPRRELGKEHGLVHLLRSQRSRIRHRPDFSLPGT